MPKLEGHFQATLHHSWNQKLIPGEAPGRIHEGTSGMIPWKTPVEIPGQIPGSNRWENPREVSEETTGYLLEKLHGEDQDKFK